MRHLSKKLSLFRSHKMKLLLRELNLNTVCEEAKCPNISECFSNRIASFMILGDVCTRDCSFCAVKRGNTKPWDITEPARIKQAAKILKLRYVVITSPGRDDLKDKGAYAFASTILAIKDLSFVRKVEALIPDFLLDRNSIKMVVQSKVDVMAHNIETVPSLYKKLRPQADYQRSLNVLKMIKQINHKMVTKSGIMLGLGEEKEEVMKVFNDLVSVGCDFLSIGQYLAPSLSHYPVKGYVSADSFDYFKRMAQKAGLKYVLSSFYVRSSYRASIYKR